MTPMQSRQPRSGDCLEVEVAPEDDGEGPTAWKPARVLRVLATEPLKFHVCIDGDPEFVEEYELEDVGAEWRWPGGAHSAAPDTHGQRDMRSQQRQARGIPRDDI